MEDDRYCKKIESGDSRLAGYLDSLLAAQPVDRFILAEDLRTNLSHEISRVGYMLPRLTAVGLTCTFLGMILALEGFNPAHLTDISKIVEVFRLTPRGMSVAFNAGLVSMVAYLWLEGLFQILQSGTVKLSSATIRAGVRFVRN